jgi:hypothetical protein
MQTFSHNAYGTAEHTFLRLTRTGWNAQGQRRCATPHNVGLRCERLYQLFVSFSHEVISSDPVPPIIPPFAGAKRVKALTLSGFSTAKATAIAGRPHRGISVPIAAPFLKLGPYP